MRNENEIVLYHQQSEHVYLPVLVSAAVDTTACINTMGFLEIIVSRVSSLSNMLLETSCDLRYSKSERI